MALCQSHSNALLAFPSRQTGHLQIVDISENKRISCIIQAHERELSCIAFNLEGTKIATASRKGTLIRIYDVESGRLINELRRGTDSANIYWYKDSLVRHVLAFFQHCI